MSLLGTHRCVTGEVGLGAAHGGRAAAAQAGWQARAADGAAVKLGLQVLQIERKVQNITVSDLRVATKGAGVNASFKLPLTGKSSGRGLLKGVLQRQPCQLQPS